MRVFLFYGVGWMTLIPIVVAAVMINEIQSSDGDWVELHNDGAASVSVSGWGLSDKENNLFRYRLSGSVPAGGYLRVKEPFGISKNGETLYLTKAGAVAPDETVVVPALPNGVSWGRVASGGETGVWRYFGKPTPGAENAGEGYAETEETPPVGFSAVRGFCRAPFELALTAADARYRIYYTLNHDDPSPETGILYERPIAIDRTTVVRAVQVREGVLGLRGSTTHTYIFPSDIPSQKKPEIAPTVWDDYGVRTASYTVREASWRPEALEELPVVSVTMSDAAMFDPSDGLYCKPVALSDVERMASYETLDDGKGVNAGFRIHGDSCRAFTFTPKKGFRISFRAEYGPSQFAGEDVIVFRCNRFDAWTNGGATYLKDQLARQLQEDTSGYSSTGDFVHVFLNGLYWGVYNRCQHPDARLSAVKFGGDRDNYNTVKHYNQVPDGDGADYRGFVANISNLTWSAVCAKLDLPAYIDYMLVENTVGNTEWPDINFVVTHSPADGVKYHFFVWDSETAYNSLAMDRLGYIPTDRAVSPQNIHLALMRFAEYRGLYGAHARRHLLDDGGSLTVSAITNRIAAYGAALASPLRAEGARWGSDDLVAGYPGKVSALCVSAARRHANFVAQLRSYGLLADAAPETLEEADATFPVPAPEPPGTNTVGEIAATLGGTTLSAGVASATVFPGVLKADSVLLTLPTAKGGSTWYGGIVAKDLPGPKRCRVVLQDGSEPEDAVYYLSSKVDVGDGRVTYCVSVPRQASYDARRVWVYESGDPLEAPVFENDDEDDPRVIEVGGNGTVGLWVHTRLGLDYVVESGATPDPSAWTATEPVAGTGLPQKLAAPAYGDRGFYRVVAVRQAGASR